MWHGVLDISFMWLEGSKRLGIEVSSQIYIQQTSSVLDIQSKHSYWLVCLQEGKFFGIEEENTERVEGKESMPPFSGQRRLLIIQKNSPGNLTPPGSSCYLNQDYGLFSGYLCPGTLVKGWLWQEETQVSSHQVLRDFAIAQQP